MCLMKKDTYFPKIDITGQFFRFRQFDPTPWRRKRTHHFGPGVEAIIEF